MIFRIFTMVFFGILCSLDIHAKVNYSYFKFADDYISGDCQIIYAGKGAMVGITISSINDESYVKINDSSYGFILPFTFKNVKSFAYVKGEGNGDVISILLAINNIRYAFFDKILGNYDYKMFVIIKPIRGQILASSPHYLFKIMDMDNKDNLIYYEDTNKNEFIVNLNKDQIINKYIIQIAPIYYGKDYYGLGEEIKTVDTFYVVIGIVNSDVTDFLNRAKQLYDLGTYGTILHLR